MSNNSTTVNKNVLDVLSRSTGQHHDHDTSRNLLKLVNIWIARSRQRKQLARLPAYLLRDIGITPAEAADEASKAFWEE